MPDLVLYGHPDSGHSCKMALALSMAGYTQWLGEAGVDPTPPMRAWLERMRGLDSVKSPAAFFP